MPTPPRYHYIVSAEFDPTHDDAQRRQWLTDMQAHMRGRAAALEVFDQEELFEIEGDGSVVVEFDSMQTAALRRARVRQVADWLEEMRRNAIAPMPPIITTKRAMAA